MTASPDQLLDQLDRTTWKTAGSTSRRPEGPTARATEGSTPVNLTVIDHIAAGRSRLEAADRAEAEGRVRRAELIRRTQAARTQTLMGDTRPVRCAPCPHCGTYSLLWKTAPGRAVCSNTHCTPITAPREWTLPEVMGAAERAPLRRFHRATDLPTDLVTLARAVRFFADTGHPASITTIRRWIVEFPIPRWRVPGSKALVVSLSDLLTAHAIRVRAARGDCDQLDDRQQPACVGHGGLFFTTDRQATAAARARAVARLCAGCPMRVGCADSTNPTERHPTERRTP